MSSANASFSLRYQHQVSLPVCLEVDFFVYLLICQCNISSLSLLWCMYYHVVHTHTHTVCLLMILYHYHHNYYYVCGGSTQCVSGALLCQETRGVYYEASSTARLSLH